MIYSTAAMIRDVDRVEQRFELFRGHIETEHFIVALDDFGAVRRLHNKKTKT